MGVGIAMILAAIISAVVGVGASVATNKSNQRAVDSTNATNLQATREANQTNLQAVRETNASNVEQANLAYERSKPVTQIANLMGAGLSRQAAIQSLSGGGSYTAPTLEIPNSQAAHADAPHFDYSGIAQAMQQLGNIPSNVAQQQITDQHLADLKQQAEIRQKQELRDQEKHDFDMWRERYGKRTAELLDGVASKVVQAASDRGYDLSSAKSVQSIMRDLGLESDRDYQNMPHLARTQLFDAIKSQNDQRISQEQHESNMLESKDKHKLSQLDLLLKRSELNEREQSLVYKLGILANNLELSNLQLDASNYEKAIRDVGFENKKEAAAAIAACEYLEAQARRDKARFRANRSDSGAAYIGYSLEWLLDNVNPLKGLISTK